MKVLAICASPRENGNTERYLNVALQEASRLGAKTELIWLGDKSLKGCRGCYGCVTAKACIVEDDFQAIFEKVCEADAILLGSPVYHASITSELKALLDRTGFSGRWAVNDMKAKGDSYAWKGSVLSGKVVAPVTVARRAGQNFAFAQILLWATCNDCIVVGNTYWNVGVAGKGGAKDALEDAEGVGIMQGLAQRVVQTVAALQQATANV